jgi:sigma-B regulation protein RsbU (phosphoserine phosphatase)
MIQPNTHKLQVRALLVIGALVISYACYALYEKTFETWNSRIIDRLFVLRTNLKPTSSLPENTVIHVDANFYANRSQHAQVIRNLASMKVAALLVDYIFFERVGDEEDLPLIRAASEAGNVILGFKFESFGKRSTGTKTNVKLEEGNYLSSTKWQLNFVGNPNRFRVGERPQLTYPELSAAARGLGYLNFLPDKDGILRRVPLLIRYQDAFYPSFAFRAVCDYLGVSAQRIVVQPGKAIILKTGKAIILKNGKQSQTAGSNDIIIPIDKSGNVIINYTGSWKQIRHYSYSEILQASKASEQMEKLKAELSGKIVILSETVEQPLEIRPIQTQHNLSTGTVHAIVIQNILAGSFLRELSRFEMLLIEIALLVVIFSLSIRFSSLALSLGTGAMAGFFIFLGAYSFISFNLIFQFIRPLLMASCALVFILIAKAIEKAIVLAETERARRIAERELEIGREIQSGFFPTALPTPDGWELVTYFQAARHVAGDFYDAFTLGEEKKIGIVIADVCDKGVGAALFMALFRSLIRVLSGSTSGDNHLDPNSYHPEPDKTLRNTIRSINNYISITHEDDGMFSTLFFGILDPEQGVLHYINAGHEPPLVISSGAIKASLSPTGPAVGLFPDVKFDVQSITLAPQDILLAFTDGVIDAQNKAGEAFTKLRLTKILKESLPSAKTVIEKISHQIQTHVFGQEQFDDITILALRRK